ncbi:major facilitator superfamily domain-containing protein [Xylaria sp. FL0043]|nr:major facilitator superfamily domain-containing protein [Xylaria sp. FL0043]
MASQYHQNVGSSTAVVELQPMYMTSSPLPPSPSASNNNNNHNNKGTEAITVPPWSGRRGSSDEEKQDGSGSAPSTPPSVAAEVKDRWNYPRRNIPRVAACFYSFIVMGANDAAYGLQEYYHLTYIVISLVFLSPFIGYTAAAFLNPFFHLRFGRRGVAFAASCSHVLAYIIIAVHPPYPVLVVAFALAGFGNGIADAGWNAYIGNMDRANELLGFLHGLYGIGAVISPLIATTMITKAGLPWYAFYYLMIGLAGLEVVVTGSCFWKATAQEYRDSVAASSGSSGGNGGLKEVLFRKPGARVAWLCAIFLLGYVGIEVALGGWIVEFMIQVRHGGAFESGITATGFWLGLTIGRFVLGFITPKIGEKLAIMIYLPITVGFELLFWLVPQFIVSAVAVGLQGFFIGPLFPAAIVAMSKLLPHHLHVGAIGFAAAFGGSGAAFLPFAVGAIAQAKGVQVLQPIILALLAAIFLVWCGLPKIEKKKD